jgi:hypothetical protein
MVCCCWHKADERSPRQFMDVDNSPDFLNRVHRIEIKVDAAGFH